MTQDARGSYAREFFCMAAASRSQKEPAEANMSQDNKPEFQGMGLQFWATRTFAAWVPQDRAHEFWGTATKLLNEYQERIKSSEADLLGNKSGRMRTNDV